MLSKVMFYTAGKKFILNVFSFTSLTSLTADEMDISQSHDKVVMILVIFFPTEEKHLSLSAQGL